MRKLLLSLCSICILNQVQAQQFEMSVQANSALFHYSGSSTASTSFIVEGEPTPKQNATNDPYGNKNAFSYGCGIQIQNISKSGFIIGLQTGYDILRSKVELNSVYPPPYLVQTTFFVNNLSFPAAGQTFLQAQFINVSSYLGYRLKVKKIKIDLMPGIDFGFNINSYDYGKAMAVNGGQTYQTNVKISTYPNDVRLKFGIAASYNRFGITAGYARGVTNYAPKLIEYTAGTIDNGHPAAYSELFRFGITYRIL